MNRHTTPGLDATIDLLNLETKHPRVPLPLVIFNRNLRSDEGHRILSQKGVVFVFFSAEAALQLQAGVFWHDEPEHCRTWTDGGGCACDVEGVDCSPAPEEVPITHMPAGMGAVIFDLRLGPNGLELRGPPRPPNERELEQLRGHPLNTPVVLPPAPASSTQAEPVVLKHEDRGPHDPKTCPTCLSRAAAAAFGPTTPPGVS